MSSNEASFDRVLREVLGVDPSGDDARPVQTTLGDLRRMARALFPGQMALPAGMASTASATTGVEDGDLVHFFRQLIDTLPDFIYFKDRESRIIFSNPAHIGNLGCKTLEEVVGKTDLDFFQEKFAREKLGDERRIVETGVGWSFKEEHHIHQDGSDSWALSTKLPLRDVNGEVCGIFGVSRDITGKKLTELELERQRVLLDTIIQILPCSLFVRDRKGRFILVNRDYLEKSGVKSPDLLVGRTLREAFPHENAAATIAEDEKVMGDAVSILNRVSYDTSLFHNKRWIATSKVPLRTVDGDVSGLVGINWDITEQKQAEESARDAYKALAERTHQMETELDIARTLQERLIAEGLDANRCFQARGPQGSLQGSLWYQPSHHLAGDFVHVARIDQARTGILICDVMGHGVKASLVTMLIRGMFHDSARFMDQPDAVLNHLNRRLAAFAEDPQFPRFVTALYLVVDLQHGSIAYANAGHLHPLIIGPSTAGSETVTSCPHEPGTALGLLPDEHYQRIELPLAPGQVVALFSDGLMEATNDVGHEFGRTRLVNCLATCVHSSPSDTISRIQAAFDQFLQGTPCQDDICLVVMHVEDGN